jgi:protein kinase N
MPIIEIITSNIRIYIYTWFNKLKRSNNKNKSNVNNEKSKTTLKSLIKNKFKQDLNKNNNYNHNIATNNNTNVNLTKSSFRFVCMLGSGQFGEVYLVECKQDNKYYAIKMINKKQMIQQDLTRIVKTEQKVFELISDDVNNQNKTCPFLVNLLTCFQTLEHVCFVMDYASGGDLITSLLKENNYPLSRVRFYSACIVLGLEYLHNKKILYRDLKLDNLLITSDGYLKIADFGISKTDFKLNDRTNTFCGTDEYMAPEILNYQSYSRAVDWWALGIVVYEMFVGKMPFANKYQRCTKDPMFPAYLLQESKSFISKLLEKKEILRLGSSNNDAEDVKKHAFFKNLKWNDLMSKSLKAPFIPIIVSKFDFIYSLIF